MFHMVCEVRKDNAFAVLGQAVSSFEDGKTYTVEIKEKKEKRSREANAYCFTLIDKLAAKLNMPKNEIYRNAIKEIGGVSEIVCVKNEAVEKLRCVWNKKGLGWQTDVMPSKINGCTNVILYYGSSVYNTEQMSRLINIIVDECKEQGIEVMSERELSLIKSEWAND